MAVLLSVSVLVVAGVTGIESDRIRVPSASARTLDHASRVDPGVAPVAERAVQVRAARREAAERAARVATATRTARVLAARRARHVAAVRMARRAAAVRRARHAAAVYRARHAAAVRRAHRRATFRYPRRTHPGHIVRGHYLRSLVGRAAHDQRIMWRLGARDAVHNPRGMGHLVLLDIGGQTRRGVRLSVVNHFVSYRGLVRAVRAYIGGYHRHQRRNAPVTIALGTNNDLYTSRRAGRLWARHVVNPLRSSARRYLGIRIAGANDIEPGFRAGPRATRRWLSGYLHGTTAPFIFNGSADGCSPRHPRSRCNHGWNARTLASLAGTVAPARIMALPQIYNPTMAAQWAQISRTAKLSRRRPLHILGPLTEQAACGRDPACPSMPSRRAWRLLHFHLRWARLHPVSLPVQVDLDVR